MKQPSKSGDVGCRPHHQNEMNIAPEKTIFTNRNCSPQLNGAKWCLLLLGLLLLVACGGTESAVEEVETAVAPTTETEEPTAEAIVEETIVEEEMAEESDTAFPLTIEHAFGSTTIEAMPERILSIGYVDQDPLIALGSTPVAGRYWFGDTESIVFPWAQDALQGEEPDVLNMTFGELNYELILSYTPDVIIAVSSGILEDEYNLLSEIAPTVAQSGDYDNFGMPWQEATQLIGDAVGKSTEAEAIVGDVQAAFDSAAEAHPEFAGKEIVVAGSRADGAAYFFFSAQDARTRFFTDMGFVAPTDLDELTGESFYVEISAEQVELLDRDLIIFSQASYLPEGADSLLNDPLLAQLDAIKEGRYVILSEELDGAFSASSVLSLPYAVDALVPQMASALGAEASEGEAESETAVSKDVEHAVGTTTIEGVPERIVVLEYSFADHLGTLGIAPVGYAVDAPPEYVLDFTEAVGAVPVGTRGEPSLEAIAELNPDLIIADLSRHEAIYDQLSEIAPTVVYNSLRGSYQDQLDAFVAIGDILDQSAEAEAILAEYQTAFETAVSSTNPDAGDFMIGVLWADGFTAHSNESFMGSFLESLGRINALEPREGETQFLLDLEGFASVNPSTIIIMCAPGDQEVLEAWQEQPLWSAFEAVENGRVYFYDRNLWSKGRGLTAFHTILDDAVSSGLLSDTESRTAQACP